MTSLSYSCIANGRTLLAELSLRGGCFRDAASSVVNLVLHKGLKKTTAHIGSFVYHALLVNGITYLCATNNTIDSTGPFAFLKEICKAFIGSPLISQVTFAHPFEFNADFQQVLGKYMMEYNRKSGDITVSTLQIQVDDVKNVMTQNIDKVLQREENLSELVDRTDDLQIAADTFQKNTTKISRKMWWKNAKMMIIIGVVLIIILTFIILLATGVIPT
ncbi:vesicle-associated membrane protein 7-like [Chelonia mydas]|uniref:vesicle-associated membrane protein 7-like n=1 Tax=Chelonia mydas TaxID=8469 RepID=UPI001CA86FCC|nr:vesicle-associated membrane protein 7-like [Chelonia mydas]